MSPREYIEILKKRRRTIVAFVAVGVLAGGVLSLLTTKVYKASAQIFVSVNSSPAAQSSSIYSGVQFAIAQVQSYSKLINSPQVLGPAEKALGVSIDKHNLEATNPPSSVLLFVSASEHDPVFAAAEANAVAVSLAKFIPQVETRLADGTNAVKATLSEPAQVPESPIVPRTKINLIIGALLGLLLGVGVVLLREQLDTSVRSADDVREITGSEPIGTISFDPKAEDQPLITTAPNGLRAESFKAIRTSLRFVDVDDPPRLLTVVSSVASEGKSTTATNLAISIAVNGQSACLVEADLRRPAAARYLGIEGGYGLTNVLSGQCALDDALVEWNRGLLTVLPAGETPPNPSELLGSDQMRMLLSELGARFDFVIIDAAPLLPVTDGAVVTSVVDGALMVVRFGSTKKEQLTRASQLIVAAGGRIAGTIVNFIPESASGYGYGYGEGYGVGYGYAPEDAEATGTGPTSGDERPSAGASADPALSAVASQDDRAVNDA